MARYAVIGAGGVGGYFGGRLAHAGADVSFLARGSHLAAMRTAGLRVRSYYGDFHVERVHATDDPAEIGCVDYVLICVKCWDTLEAARAAGAMVGPHTAVISLQNGVEKEETIAGVVGPEHVVGGLTYVISRIAAPGAIEQIGPTAKVVVGERDGQVTPRALDLARDFRAAGIDLDLSTEIVSDIWRKFLHICAFSGTCTVTRSALGPVLRDPDTRALFIACMEEVKAVADAKGIPLEPDIVQAQLARADGFAPEAKPSMLTDLERGNRLELDWLSGAVSRMGRELGIPTPANHFIYTALKFLRNGAAPG